jgi:hypothetical protein
MKLLEKEIFLQYSFIKFLVSCLAVYLNLAKKGGPERR